MSASRRIRLWGPVLLQAAALFYLSSRSDVPNGPDGWDKIAHFVSYAILCALLLRALHGGFGPLRAKLALAAVGLATLYGAGDELHQSFVPGRDSSVFDLAADFAGASAAALALGFWYSRGRTYFPPFSAR